MREPRTGLPEVVRFKAPAGFMRTLTEASALDCSTASAFVRLAALEKLRAMGFPVPGNPRKRGGDSTANAA